MSDAVVRNIQFAPDGSIIFDFMASDDLRENGMMMSRALFVPPGDELHDLELADLLQDLVDTAQRTFSRCLAGHEGSPSPTVDDGSRPFDNPEGGR